MRLAKHFMAFHNEFYKFINTRVCMLDSIYHMTLLLFSGKGHVINNVMTTHCITLSGGTSNIMTTSITTKQIFMEINKLLR